MYGESAGSYSEMMDEEINNPLYADILERLSKRLKGIEGPLFDVACGSGHMLAMYQQQFDPGRPLVGVDLTEEMVAIASARLGQEAEIRAGDMRRLDFLESASAASVLNFFAMHHIDPDDLLAVRPGEVPRAAAPQEREEDRRGGHPQGQHSDRRQRGGQIPTEAA